MSLGARAPRGCFVEVDPLYSPHLHHYHNDFPLAAESICVDENGNPSTKESDCKLIPHLGLRMKYVCYYRLFQY